MGTAIRTVSDGAGEAPGTCAGPRAAKTTGTMLPVDGGVTNGYVR